MKTKGEQDIYLQGMIEAVTVKKRSKRKEEGKNRSRSFYHFLSVNGKKIKNFNLHFGRPQVDTCTKCEELALKIKSSTLGDAAKKAAVAEEMVHKRRSKKFYTYLKTSSTECKQRNDLGVICFDYMQNLQLPLIPLQDVFYLHNSQCQFFVSMT
nr:unnamed protein product [Callosobruchus chinensis]